MSAILERVSKAALDLLYPPQCGVCGRAGTLLCEDCTAGLPPADGARCGRCWSPARGGDVCGECRAAPHALTSLRAPFVLAEGARSLVHQLKYDRLSSLAGPMSRLMAPSLDAGGVDVIVPVPLHRGRRNARGFNQAVLLGRPLAAAHAIAFDDRLLRRMRPTPPLVTTLHREERWAIVKDAFAADATRARGRRVLLVDDVVTSGSTMEACARVLRAAGAASVRGFAFAVAR
jgi:ComF family protein